MAMIGIIVSPCFNVGGICWVFCFIRMRGGGQHKNDTDTTTAM